MMQKETCIVIEDPTLNAQVNSGSRREPCLKKDSSHLILPNVTTVQEGKKHNRFLAPPSSFQTTNDAAIVRSIRSKAVRSKDYKLSVIPYGYAGVKNERKGPYFLMEPCIICQHSGWLTHNYHSTLHKRHKPN